MADPRQGFKNIPDRLVLPEAIIEGEYLPDVRVLADEERATDLVRAFLRDKLLDEMRHGRVVPGLKTDLDPESIDLGQFADIFSHNGSKSKEQLRTAYDEHVKLIVDASTAFKEAIAALGEVQTYKYFDPEGKDTATSYSQKEVADFRAKKGIFGVSPEPEMGSFRRMAEQKSGATLLERFSVDPRMLEPVEGESTWRVQRTFTGLKRGREFTGIRVSYQLAAGFLCLIIAFSGPKGQTSPRAGIARAKLRREDPVNTQYVRLVND